MIRGAAHEKNLILKHRSFFITLSFTPDSPRTSWLPRAAPCCPAAAPCCSAPQAENWCSDFNLSYFPQMCLEGSRGAATLCWWWTWHKLFLSGWNQVEFTFKYFFNHKDQQINVWIVHRDIFKLNCHCGDNDTNVTCSLVMLWSSEGSWELLFSLINSVHCWWRHSDEVMISSRPVLTG